MPTVVCDVTLVTVLRHGGAVDECWVAVEGPLDEQTSVKLSSQLRALVAEGCRRLVVDLRRTVDIESTGLRVLIEAMRAMEELGGTLALRAPPRQVYELGRVRRLGDLLATVDDAVDEAEALHRLDRLFSSP